MIVRGTMDGPPSVCMVLVHSTANSRNMLEGFDWLLTTLDIFCMLAKYELFHDSWLETGGGPAPDRAGRENGSYVFRRFVLFYSTQLCKALLV